MKTIPDKLIHIATMPCSHIPELLEQEDAGKLSHVNRVRLRVHLSLCKWCNVYARKVRQIDKLLAKMFQNNQNLQGFKDFEIQEFKDGVRKKINPLP